MIARAFGASRLRGFRALVIAALLLVTSRDAQAQRSGNLDLQIRENQARLDSIRHERSTLEDELDRLRGRARDLTTELRNIERQKNITNRLVNELDRQMGMMSSQLDTITMDLMLAQDALAETRAVLERRLAQIYKRGHLWAFQVLLAAESFGDLLSRYKYLYLVSRQDRALVNEIENLTQRITVQRRELLSAQGALATQREQRSVELQRFVRLERGRQNILRQTQTASRETVSRLDSLARAEDMLNSLVARLEDERRSAVARGERTNTVSSITHAARGTLNWPADGRIVYRFGLQAGPDGTRIRRHGIGIAVPVGTAVRAVASGTVESTRGLGTYGPTVLIFHGGGFYSLYLYLSRFDVQTGQSVTAGQVIGRSGGAGSPAGPHVEFQLREQAPGSQSAIALDPENWLRKRR